WSFISALKISPSGRFLAVIHGAPPTSLDIYDIVHERVISQHQVEFGGSGCSVAWSPDERYLAFNGDQKFFVFEMPGLTLLCEFPIRFPCFGGFSPSGRYLGIGSWQKSFVVPVEMLGAFAESQQ